MHNKPLEELKRVTALFSSQATGLGLAFLSTVVVAWRLDPSEFGEFTFLRSAALYLGIFFEFGTSIATGRLLGLSEESHESANLCGAWLALFFPIAIGYSLLFAATSVWVGKIFRLEITTGLLLSAVPAFGVPLERALRELLRGRGSACSLAILNVAPWVLFLLGLLGAGIYSLTSLEVVVCLYFGSFSITTVVLTLMLRPRFYQVREFLSKILAETRSFGLEAYIGRVVGTGTFQLDSPMIAYFAQDPAVVGFYGLAKALVAPISLGAGSLSIAMYRDLVRAKRLTARLICINLLWLVSLVLLYYLFARLVVFSLFSLEYAGVLPLLYILILAAFAQGAYQLPNSFLAAKGEGRVLRNMAIWFGAANILLNLSLIPPFGAHGAAVASAAANGFWLYMCVRSYYQRTTLDANSYPAQPRSI